MGANDSVQDAIALKHLWIRQSGLEENPVVRREDEEIRAVDLRPVEACQKHLGDLKIVAKLIATDGFFKYCEIPFAEADGRLAVDDLGWPNLNEPVI